MATPDAIVKKALDQIDNYNIGAAETTLSNALSKFPEHVDLLAVQSLLLLRQGMHDDAAAIACRLIKKDRLKDGTVNVLAHVLQNTCCYAELASVYERAVTLMGGPDAPQTVNAQENLLNAYILSNQLAEAQKTAALLQKKTGKHEFLMRGMMCNIAQVPETTSDHMLLKIATKMIAATFKSNHCLQPHTCQMYVNLLIQQELFDEAIAFVLSSQGKFLGLAEQRYVALLKVLDAQLAFLQRKADSKGADADTDAAGASSSSATPSDEELIMTVKRRIGAAARQGWLLDADNWSFAQRYMKSIAQFAEGTAASSIVIPLADFPKPSWSDAGTAFTASQASEANPAGWIVDLTMAAALSFTTAQQTSKRSASKCLRGPFMAEIALLLVKLQQSTGGAADADAVTAAITQKTVAYANKFDSKGTCYLDLATLFAEASPATAATALNAVIADLSQQEEALLAANSTVEKDIITIHRKRILRIKLQLLATPIAAVTEEAIEALGALLPSLKGHYDACREYSTSLEWSEEGQVDGYLLVMANISLRQWYYYRQNAVAMGSAANPAMVGMANRCFMATLEAFTAMDRKKNNPGTLLFSTLFNQQLGIADMPSLDQLDFKAIQHSSMHPVACQPLLRGCAFTAVKTYFEHAYDRFYVLGKKEVANLKAKVFQHLTWPKVGELERFEHRLLRGLPRQEALVFSALVKLREMQTSKYTQLHAVRHAKIVEGALVAVCKPSANGGNGFLGYGEQPVAALLKQAASSVAGGEKEKEAAAAAALNIKALWDSILSETDCSEGAPEEDEQFFMAFLFADLKSADAKAMKDALLDRDDRKYRRQQVVLGAIGMLLLNDVALFEAKKAAATASAAVAAATAAAAKGGKNSKAAAPNAAATAANAAAISNPLAAKAFMVKKYGLTPDTIKQLAATVAPRFSPTSTSSGGVQSASAAAMKASIEILAAMAGVVAELIEVVDAIGTADSAAVTKNNLWANSPARAHLSETLKTAISIKGLADPTTASANGLDAAIAGGAFPLLFPLGITLSSFLTMLPYPSECAVALKDGLLKEAKDVITEAMKAANEAANAADIDALTKALSQGKAANLKSFFMLVDDLCSDVNASSKRKL